MASKNPGYCQGDKLEPGALFLFHGSRPPEGLAFSKPCGSLAWTWPTPATAFFSQLEQALARGHWLAGYFTYEAGYALEPKLQPCLARAPKRRPLAWFSLHRAPVRVTGEWIRAQVEALDPPRWSDYWLQPLAPAISPRAYSDQVKKIKSLIAQGHTYQINYTFPLKARLYGNRKALFWHLLDQQPVGYAAWLRGGGREVFSFSPELFFRRSGSAIMVKPMKGTAARSENSSRDAALRAALEKSAKNQAENIMIVDLMRNDLGRLCLPGSVKASRICEVETFATLHQMTSTVTGRLQPGVTWQDIFRSLFPCGSVTGAPKVRSMEIIAELEGEPRGIYTGALGFISPRREAVFNVPIRTLELDRTGAGIFGTGSGIVADSTPGSEWRECRLKSRFFEQAVRTYQLLETLAWEPGQGFRLLCEHVDRMQASAAYFHIPFQRDRVVAALHAWARKAGRRPQRVRLLSDPQGRLSVEASELKPVPPGARVRLSRLRVSPKNSFLYHKTTHREAFDRETREAQARGFWESLVMNHAGRLTEGTFTNLFIRKGGIWLTPPVKDGLLPGIARARRLENKDCREHSLRRQDLVGADEIAVANSVRGFVTVLLAL